MYIRGTHFSRFWKFVGGGGFSHYFAACDFNDAKNIEIKGGLGVANWDWNLRIYLEICLFDADNKSH